MAPRGQNALIATIFFVAILSAATWYQLPTTLRSLSYGGHTAAIFFRNASVNQTSVANEIESQATSSIPGSINSENYSSITAINGRISSIRIGLDQITVENACYSKQENKVYLFTDHDSDLEPFLAKNSVARNIRMHIKWGKKPIAEWSWMLETAGGFASEENTLILVDNELPAHCLHDFLFSAFLLEKDGLKFQEYLSTSSPGRECHPKRNWCCFAFHRAGVIDSTRPAKFSEPYSCYKKLTALYFGHARFAPNWDVAPKLYRLPVYAMDKGLFPLQNLETLHRRLLTFDDAVTFTRKPVMRYMRRNILILDRLDVRRRIWANSREFVTLFVSRWPELSTEKLGNVIYYGASFSELTPLEQARLFYQADVIISPHGAQLSNLIFGEANRTASIEVGCPEEDDKFRAWKLTELDMEWFATFPLRLGMLPYIYRQPPQCDHNLRSFTIEPEPFFAFVKSLGLFNTTLKYAPVDGRVLDSKPDPA